MSWWQAVLRGFRSLTLFPRRTSVDEVLRDLDETIRRPR